MPTFFMTRDWLILNAVNVVILAGGKFHENVRQSLRMGVNFVILLQYIEDVIFVWG